MRSITDDARMSYTNMSVGSLRWNQSRRTFRKIGKTMCDLGTKAESLRSTPRRVHNVTALGTQANINCAHGEYSEYPASTLVPRPDY